MTLYAVHAQVLTEAGSGFRGSRAVPTFYLDSRVQGIKDRAHAQRIARDVVDPLGAIGADRLMVAAIPVDPARESAELDAFHAGQSARLVHDSACADGGHGVTCNGTTGHAGMVPA